MDSHGFITRSDSLSSKASDGSTSESRFRGKLGNRRSILNQVNDGIIRRAESFSDSQKDVESSNEARQCDDDRQNETVASSQSRADLQRVKALLFNSSDSRYTTMSPCTTENLRRLKEVTSRSISRSRQRKEVAEERLKCLMSAATRSESFDDGASLFYSHSKSGSSEDGSQKRLPPRINRNLFGSNISPENDENNLVRPKARKALPPTRGSSDALMEVGNITISSDNDALPSAKGNDEKQHYSQQMNISVMDNFFLFKV